MFGRQGTIGGAGGGTPTPAPTLPTLTAGQFGLSSTPVTVAAPAGSLGSYVLLGTLTDSIDELLLDLAFASSGRALAISIKAGSVAGVGGTLIVDRLLVHDVGSSYTPVRLPINVPAGRLEIAIGANVAGDAYVAPSAVKFDIPRVTTIVEPLTAINYAALLNTGTALTMVADAAGAWTNIGSPLVNDGRGFIISCQNGNDFGRSPAGPVSIQLSLDGANVLASTLTWQTTSTLSLRSRTFQHDVPAGTQLRARAFSIAGTSSDNISFSASVIR